MYWLQKCPVSAILQREVCSSSPALHPPGELRRPGYWHHCAGCWRGWDTRALWTGRWPCYILDVLPCGWALYSPSDPEVWQHYRRTSGRRRGGACAGNQQAWLCVVCFHVLGVITLLERSKPWQHNLFIFLSFLTSFQSMAGHDWSELI